jgi:hypothetical protein
MRAAHATARRLGSDSLGLGAVVGATRAQPVYTGSRPLHFWARLDH